MLLALFGARLGLHAKWITDRHAALQDARICAYPRPSMPDWRLWMLGEQGYSSVWILLDGIEDITPTDKQQAAELKSLFPESQVEIGIVREHRRALRSKNSAPPPVVNAR